MSNENDKSPSLSDDEYVDYPTSSNETDEQSNLVESYGSRPKNLKPSIISEGFSFVGEIKAPGGFLTVDGQLQGAVDLENLIIGSNGSVNGTLIADTVTVKGELMGQVTTRDLMVGTQAVIDGQVTYDSITIQRGGTIKGDLKRSK